MILEHWVFTEFNEFNDDFLVNRPGVLPIVFYSLEICIYVFKNFLTYSVDKSANTDFMLF